MGPDIKPSVFAGRQISEFSEYSPEENRIIESATFGYFSDIQFLFH
jgi:hypothetical protein